MAEQRDSTKEKVIEYGPLKAFHGKVAVGPLAVASFIGVMIGAMLGFNLPQQNPPAPIVPDYSATLDTLKAELQKQQIQVHDLSKRMEDLISQPHATFPTQSPFDHNMVSLLAVLQLRERLDKRQPHEAELDALQALSAQDPELSALVHQLADALQQQLPEPEELRQRLIALQQISSGTPDNSHLWQRILTAITAPVSIRRIDEAANGDSREAVFARAEAKLAQHDFPGFRQEIEKLPDDPDVRILLADTEKLHHIDEILSAIIAHISKMPVSAAENAPSTSPPGPI